MESSKRTQTHFDDEIFIVGDMYYYRGTPIGSKKREEFSLGVRVGAAQKDVLKAKKEKLENRGNVGEKAGKNSFSIVARAYLADREAEAKDPENLSAHSLYESQNLILKHFLPHIGNTRVDELDQQWFNDYCTLKHKQGHNLVNHRKVINHFLKWCVAEKYIRMRPELGIPKKARKERRQRIVATDAEFLKIIETATGNLLLYIVLYAMHGMRNREILRLMKADCDLKAWTIWIDKKNNRTRKSRSINMNRYAHRILSERLHLIEGDYVFPNQRSEGKTPFAQNMHKVFKELLGKAGVNQALTPHDLRAFFETHMHTNPAFTDTQREKMVGARIDVQKDTYVRMQAKQVKGLEDSVKIKGLDKLLNSKIKVIRGGKAGGTQAKASPSKAVSNRKKVGKRK